MQDEPENKPQTPYEVLGVKEDATPQDIRSAFKRKALQTHPDSKDRGNRAATTATFPEIKEAYEFLSKKAGQSKEPSTENKDENTAEDLNKSIVPFELDEIDKSIVPFNPEDNPLPKDDSIEEKKPPLALEPLYKPARKGEKLNCYKILGVDPSASLSMIELAFIKLLELLMERRQFNVVTGNYYFSNPKDMIAFNRLVTAEEIVRVPDYRKIHDSALANSNEKLQEKEKKEEIKAETQIQLAEMPDTTTATADETLRLEGKKVGNLGQPFNVNNMKEPVKRGSDTEAPKAHTTQSPR